MSQIRSNALQVLQENFKQVEGGITLREYVENEASADPGFFGWLFNEKLEQDFDSSLTEEHRAAYAAFLETLTVKRYIVNKVIVVNRGSDNSVLETLSTDLASPFLTYGQAKDFYETVELPEHTLDADLYKEIFELPEQ